MSIQAVSWVLEYSQSRGLARLVMLSLANHANDSDQCWPSQRTIAREAGISLGAVSNHIQALIELGELELVQKGSHRRSSRYRLLRSRDELSVHAAMNRTISEEEATTTSSDGSVHDDAFAAFIAERAVVKVRERKRKGLSVLSDAGLAKTIQSDPEHVAECERLWAHRDCEKCKGSGVVEVYSPGAGTREVVCA